MDLDELFPDKPGDPLTLLVRQDLDPFRSTSSTPASPRSKAKSRG